RREEESMRRTRIGELLRGMVPLTDHDVEEILHEQKGTGKRFGEIALSWGLCEPEHVWRAWCSQTGDRLERVHLDRVGVDSQATSVLSREEALRNRAIPVRVFEHLIVVAISDTAEQETLRNELEQPDLEIKFVLADPIEIDWAIETYYQPLVTA